MKKLLVILALCMVLSVVLVACNNTDTSEETTPEVTTPEVTTPEATTPEETTDAIPEGTTPEETTPEATTPEETTPEDTTEPEPEIDPADPVFMIPGADMASSLVGNNCIGEVVTAEDGSYITVNTTANTPYDPWYLLPMVTADKGYVASHIAIKYRSAATNVNRAEIFVGSQGGPDGQGDNIAFDIVCDGEWQVVIIDLAQASKVLDGKIAYLRWDAFVGAEAADAPIDLAWIGAFNAPEYAYDYFVETTYTMRGNEPWSFDTVYLNSNMYFEQDGGAADKLAAINNTITINYGADHYELHERGWIGFTQEIAAFGYYIEGVTPIIYDDSFITRLDASDPVKGAGGEFAERFEIKANLAELTYGNYTVAIVAKLADGTVVVMYETIVEIKNLTVDTNTNFMVSIDFVNGKGPFNAETNDWAANYAGVGGVSTGKIDAAVDHKTNDKNGLLTFGGWCGVPGGVNRYVWSIDGVNWMEVVSGGKDGEPLEGYYNSLNTEEGMTSTKNGLFNTGAEITIDLSIFPAGAQGNVMIGAIPELNQNSVIVICELANVTVAPVVETVYYNGENGTFSVPANFETKFFVRGGAAGMTMTIANADKFTITATNFAGDPATLTAVDGKIVIEIPADWDSFELTIVNNNAEAAEVAISFEAPAAETSGLVMGENTVEVTVENYYCPGVDMTFTATEAGTYTFGGDAAFIWCVEKDEGFSTPWTVELAAGDTLTLNIGVDDVMAIEGGNGNVTIVLNITKA